MGQNKHRQTDRSFVHAIYEPGFSSISLTSSAYSLFRDTSIAQVTIEAPTLLDMENEMRRKTGPKKPNKKSEKKRTKFFLAVSCNFSDR
jgi:hypothetical protein